MDSSSDDHETDSLDEWASVGAVLGAGGLLESETQLGRVLRASVIALADPDLNDDAIDAIRYLTRAMNRLADRRGQ